MEIALIVGNFCLFILIFLMIPLLNGNLIKSDNLHKIRRKELEESTYTFNELNEDINMKRGIHLTDYQGLEKTLSNKLQEINSEIERLQTIIKD